MADGPTLSIVEILVIAPWCYRRALEEFRRVITRFTVGLHIHRAGYVRKRNLFFQHNSHRVSECFGNPAEAVGYWPRRKEPPEH